MKRTTLITVFLAILLLNLSIFDVNSKSKGLKTVNFEPEIADSSTVFNFDGIISEGEWDNQHKINFSLDVGNADGDIDGQNFLYLGRDSTNLYVAYDFVSDQTDDETDEWFGMWFNTNQRDFSTEQQWHDYLNNGTESFIYQIDQNQICPYFDPTIQVASVKGLNNDTEYSVQYGFTEGNYYFNKFNVTSEFDGSHYLYWINFSIYIPPWFPMFSELYLNNMSSLRFLFQQDFNISIAEHKLILWNPDGSMPAFDDPYQVLPLDNRSSFVINDLDVGLGNITSNQRIQFTLFGNNSNAFEYTTSQLSFFPRTHTSYQLNSWIDQAYTTLNNYAIKWSFKGSPNNSTAHRMFELIFPLNQFEEYNSTYNLGFLIGGYGTAAFPDTDYWCYPGPTLNPFPFDTSADYYYVLINATSIYIPPTDDDDDDDDDSKGRVNIAGFDLYILIALIGVISAISIRKLKK